MNLHFLTALFNLDKHLWYFSLYFVYAKTESQRGCNLSKDTENEDSFHLSLLGFQILPLGNCLYSITCTVMEAITKWLSVV